MSKWLTNANIKLDGDLIKAASYIGFAKRKAAVWQQMSKYFATDITKIFPLADALIKINVGPEKKMIYIKGLEEGAEILNGVTVAANNTGGLGTAKTYINVTTGGTTVRNVDAFYPGSIDSPMSRAWRLEPRLGGRGLLNPNLYTGKMEKAVQLISGTRNSPCKYRFDFPITHGIYTDANGKDWLIEISFISGVLAKPLVGKKIKGKSKSILASHGFKTLPDGSVFPSGAQLDAAILAGSVIRLISQLDLSNIFYKAGNATSIAPHIGWAFSASGAKASNIALIPTVEGSATYLRSRLVTISFTGVTSTLAATINIVADGYFYPSATSINNLIDKNHTPYLTGYTGPDYSAPPTQPNGPVYVYYDGENQML